MKRTTRNAARTRQEIIEKAAPLFNVYGFAGTSMKQLVEATGFQMGGIYRHFSTKKELAKAVFVYSFEELVQKNLAVQPTIGAKKQLLGFITNYRNLVIQPSIPGGCPMLNTAIEVDDTDAEFRRLVQGHFQGVLTQVDHILQEGQAQGDLQQGFDPQKEALFLIAAFEGAVMIGKLTRSAEAVFAIFDQLTAHLEQMVFQQN
ncbi:MAG: TetR/AcrR family transcriptional regulator [Bacteroidota bacterium]